MGSWVNPPFFATDDFRTSTTISPTPWAKSVAVKRNFRKGHEDKDVTAQIAKLKANARAKSQDWPERVRGGKHVIHIEYVGNERLPEAAAAVHKSLKFKITGLVSC